MAVQQRASKENPTYIESCVCFRRQLTGTRSARSALRERRRVIPETVAMTTARRRGWRRWSEPNRRWLKWRTFRWEIIPLPCCSPPWCAEGPRGPGSSWAPIASRTGRVLTTWTRTCTFRRAPHTHTHTTAHPSSSATAADGKTLTGISLKKSLLTWKNPCVAQISNWRKEGNIFCMKKMKRFNKISMSITDIFTLIPIIWMQFCSVYRSLVALPFTVKIILFIYSNWESKEIII